MRNIFIINPNAGKRGRAAQLAEKITNYFIDRDDEFKIYMTGKDTNLATELARQEAEKGDEIRVFACGGDGTMFEVLNGIIGHENASLGVIPCGTANDFLKYFGDKAFKKFGDITAQLNGKIKKLDAIKACGHYSLNSCSIGMDADVCANKDRFSKLPMVSGQGAYIMSLFYCFLHSIKNCLTVTIDDKEPRKGNYLFAVAGNGRYYGGGFKSTPDAIINDGLLDCMTIKSVSRAKITSLLKKYSAGKHIGLEICDIERGKKMHVKAEKETAVNMDGEVFMAKEVTFEIVPEIVNFIIPQGCIGEFC